MKKIFMLAAVALLALGMVSCNRGKGKWVDLGLPSGLLWAECNLGASSPEDYGYYYAWGETKPKAVYDWKTYLYGKVDSDGLHESLNKYSTDYVYGTKDNLTELKAVDDAAAAVLGGGARIPTQDEWQELLDNCRREMTSQNGVYGVKFTGPNDKSLFLPAAGYRIGSSLYNDGTNGYYWSASLYESYQYGAWGMYFFSVDQGVGNGYRYHGLSVRAVRSQN